MITSNSVLLYGFLLALSPICLSDDARVPPALLALERARSSIRAGEFEWTVTGSQHPGEPRHYRARFAKNGDWIFEDRGDTQGGTMHLDATGRATSTFPLLYMRNSQGHWLYHETQGSVWVVDSYAEASARFEFGFVQDVRNLGVAVSIQSVHPREHAVWDDPNDKVVEWSQYVSNGRCVVEGRCQSGATLKWEINPDKGWNAERIQCLSDGKATREVRCTLERYGSTWFPRRVEYYAYDKLVRSIELESVKFNSPNSPEAFTGKDLGLEAGTMVCPGRHGAPDSSVWDGENVVSHDWFYEQVKLGNRALGPNRKRENQTGRFESPYLTPQDRTSMPASAKVHTAGQELHKHEGIWEKYVLEFIEHYSLNEDQAAKAREFLRQAQADAARVLDRRMADFTEAANALVKAQAGKDSRREKEAADRLAELRRPIDEIFEKQLKPRLDQLPTRAQRKKADGDTRDGQGE